MKVKHICTVLTVLLLLTGCTNSEPASNLTDDSSSGDPASLTADQIAENTQSPAPSPYPPFTGIDISEESAAIFSTLNNKPDMPQIFCCGGDIVYFSNPQDGLKLYSYDGEKTNRLSDIQAFSLNYYDGSVYFLSSDSPVNLEDHINQYGTLYRYDTKSGKVSQLSDISMSRLHVDEEGIYYVSLYDDTYYVYKADTENGTGEPQYGGFSFQHIDGYSIINESKETGIDYFLKSDQDKLWLMSDAITLFDCVYNGIYYYRDYNDSYNLYSLDLRDGEKKLLYEESRFSDYTFFDGDLYLAIQGRLYRYSLESELKPFEYSNNKDDNSGIVIGYIINSLYTDNGTMYALVSDLENHNTCFYFAQLDISVQEGVLAVNIIG